jgi:16S rRNA (cytidine1402-2'-O)-methyltransferase
MLYIVATPIGNLSDLSVRAIQALRDADVIACEDTRRTRILLSHFQIAPSSEMLSYRQGNEQRVGTQLLGLLQAGRNVALCSDGGYPGISDPGYRLIRLAIENGHAVQVVPGASAVHVALLSSGLSTSSYTFKGYPPRKASAMQRFFAEERDLPHTLVVFESPMRVFKALAVALQTLGDRQAAVCVELTKKFERVSRGFLGELCRQFDGQSVRGEVTIVIAGNNPKFQRQPETPPSALSVAAEPDDD